MILVVDDDSNLVKTLSTVIKKEGYSVTTASDGVEAYKHLKSPDCKCMLLDVNMPNINGIELLVLMQLEGINTPTILMAGFDDFNEGEMKQFTNVVHYMHKPFETDEMLGSIRKYALK